MGIQLVALAKLKLVAGAGGGAAHGPALILLKSLMWLFVIKIPFATAISRAYPDVVSSSSSLFFLFRLTRILFQDPSLSRGGRRWDRAIRLIRSSAANVRYQEAEASFHQLSMISL